MTSGYILKVTGSFKASDFYMLIFSEGMPKVVNNLSHHNCRIDINYSEKHPIGVI